MDAAGLRDVRVRSVGRAPGRVWIADCPGSPIVLRRCDESTARWLHGGLARLADEFPVPRPISLFNGGTLLMVDDQCWEALTYLPGREIGWDTQPRLEDVGAFLAAFHEVSLRVTADHRPRRDGTRLSDLHRLVDPDGAFVTMGSTDGADTLRALVATFDADLHVLGYRALPPCVVHGDPTTFNILADGQPPEPVALIDFELADVEAAVADIAFCLWRSGRPSQHAVELDVTRVRALVAGYQSVRPLSDNELAVLPLCLRGRGLQMLVKRTRARVADAGPLAQVRWITTHDRELVAAVR